MSSASADTVTLDHGFLKIALPDAFEIIDGTTGPVVLNGFDPDGGGNFTVEQADITFPSFSGTLLGFPLEVAVTPNGNISGNYNAATGALTSGSTSFTSTIDFNGQPCVITPIPLSFSTATNTVFNGNAFDAGSPPLNGAISDDWATLPLGTGAGCTIVNSATQGPGGLWLSNGVVEPSFVPPPPPAAQNPPATTTPTKKKKCKKSKKKGKSASAAKGCKKKKK